MNSKSRNMVWLPITAAVFLIAGLWIGRAMGTSSPASRAQAKLGEVFNILTSNYVDEVDLDSLVELTLPELLKNLDPHSNYIAAADRAAANRDLESSFFGVGIQFQVVNDTLYVVEVISGGAAEREGMLPGDRIVAVDGQSIAGVGVSTEDIMRRLRGPEGSHVSVTVKRNNSPHPIELDIVRAEVPVSPIDAAYIINDTIAYIRLGKFSENTYEEFLRTFAGQLLDGATSLILDLRGNGGGYMLPAVLMANEFFGNEEHLIVSTRGRNLDDNRTISSDRTGSFGNYPVAVLTDEFTASSSEILAGALQDNDRALIIGRRTFGKGLVQTPFELSDSSEFRLTVQRYYTPSGRCIQKTYAPGSRLEYESEVYNRYSNGEIFSADSIHIDSTQIFHTTIGRPVYGGGGIMPDIFVPSDTTGVTSYYIRVANAGYLRDFAYEYADLNRESLSQSTSTDNLLAKLPSDFVLLQSFVNYAANRGVPARWYYINTSAPLIVNQIKALITRDILGMNGYFEVINDTDPAVARAVETIVRGQAWPARVNAQNRQ